MCSLTQATHKCFLQNNNAICSSDTPGGGEEVAIDAPECRQCHRDGHDVGVHAQELLPKGLPEKSQLPSPQLISLNYTCNWLSLGLSQLGLGHLHFRMWKISSVSLITLFMTHKLKSWEKINKKKQWQLKRLHSWRLASLHGDAGWIEMLAPST